MANTVFLTAAAPEAGSAWVLPEIFLRPELFPLWMGLSFLLGAILALGLFFLIRWICRKTAAKKAKKAKSTNYPNTEEPPEAPLADVQISKLHEQGARSGQQDCFAVSPAELIASKGTLAVVCDGMGGLQDGDKVSQAAVSAMLNGFLELQGDPERLLTGLLHRANRAVNQLLGPAGQRRSGTTMVAGILKDNRFAYLSVGDSRICLFRDSQLIQLNREHIYGRELALDAINDLRSFREVWNDPQHGALTSFLGMGDLKYVDLPACALQVLPADKLILMSDGVYNALTEAEMIKALSLPSGEDTAALGEAIAEKHYEHQDNYTAVVITVPTA